MSADGPASTAATGESRRPPRVFSADDPNLVRTDDSDAAIAGLDASVVPDDASSADPVKRASAGVLLQRGIHWGAILVSALASAAAIAAGLWFTRFVSVAFERDDWIGLTVRGLIGVAALAAVVLLLREIIGWWRLARLGRLRSDADAALAAKDGKAERRVADRIVSLYRGRPDLRWGLDRLRTHRGDVLDPQALLALTEREVVAPLDAVARRVITRSAKRVATVTALAPLASIAFGYVVFENIGLLRRLAALYGGRPGLAGAVRLAGSVVGHLIAAGGLAMTDDLVGQFIGQDVLRRLSRRLGEGAFNGALTARIGVAAIGTVRPLPFIEAPPIRAEPSSPTSCARPPARQQKKSSAERVCRPRSIICNQRASISHMLPPYTISGCIPRHCKRFCHSR